MNPVRRLCALAMLACLGGCLSIPLSTVDRLRGMEAAEIASLDPAEVRVRTSFSNAYELDPGSATLEFRTRTEGAPAEGSAATLELEVLDRTEGTRSHGILRRQVDVTTYSLGLTEVGRAEMRSMQSTLSGAPVSTASFEARWAFADTRGLSDEVQVWIELLLTPGDGYFPLLDGLLLEVAD